MQEWTPDMNNCAAHCIFLSSKLQNYRLTVSAHLARLEGRKESLALHIRSSWQAYASAECKMTKKKKIYSVSAKCWLSETTVGCMCPAVVLKLHHLSPAKQEASCWLKSAKFFLWLQILGIFTGTKKGFSWDWDEQKWRRMLDVLTLDLPNPAPPDLPDFHLSLL